MSRLVLAFLLFPLTALAQLPAAKPQAADFMSEVIEIELRLKRADGTTVKLHVPKFGTVNAGSFVVTIPCWNKVSACPEVNALTVRVFLRLPWAGSRANVTRYALCAGSECQLNFDDGTPDGSATFPAISAKPGEAYIFRFDRLKGRLTPQPSIVKL